MQVHRRNCITQRKIEEPCGAPSCPRCEGRGDNHTEACRKRLDDIQAAEAEAAVSAAPATGIDIRQDRQLHHWEAQK